MGGLTTVALISAGTKIAGSVGKGFLANDAAKEAARMAGRLNLEKEQLEKESVAQLEQNFLDAVKVQSDIYDKAIQANTVLGSTIVEAAREGDQRGVAASAGKVSVAQNQSNTAIADDFANKKTNIDLARAAAGEKSASEIAALQDDRAAAAGVKADALTQQADNLRGQSTGAFIDAGVTALDTGVQAFGGAFGGVKGKKAIESKTKDAADLAMRVAANPTGINVPNIPSVEDAQTGMQDLLGAIGGTLKSVGKGLSGVSDQVLEYIKKTGKSVGDYTQEQLDAFEKALNK